MTRGGLACPTTCPFTLHASLADTFGLDAALAKLPAARLPATEARDMPIP